MDRRRFLGHLAGAAGVCLLPGACANVEAMAVGVHPWIGYEPLLLGREFAWLPRHVVLVEGAVAGDSMARMCAGELDAAALTLDEVLRCREREIPLSVVAVLDHSVGADMLLARTQIWTLGDLRGKRIGVERSAVGATMLAKIMEIAGLDSDALTVVDLPPNKQVAAWIDGSVDAVVTYEPTASMLMRHGAARLFDSRQVPETIFDVLAVRADRVFDPAATVGATLAAHFRGVAHIRAERQDALRRIAARHKVSPQEAERALAGVLLPDATDNLRYLRNPAGLERAAAELNRLMAVQGLLAAPVSCEGLVDPRPLEALLRA